MYNYVLGQKNGMSDSFISVSMHSNLTFALLGCCLVEHLYPGMTYEDYVQKNILQPLNMSSTGFNYTEAYVHDIVYIS